MVNLKGNKKVKLNTWLLNMCVCVNAAILYLHLPPKAIPRTTQGTHSTLGEALS